MKNMLEVKHIVKSFHQFPVLEDVSITFLAGTVHILMGENGAGKSTLLKIISGNYPADSGKLYIDGAYVSFKTPLEAKKQGIAMVYQELTLLPELTVLDNLFLGSENTGRTGLIDRKKQRRRFNEVSNEYGIQVDENALVRNLPLSKQCMVEILKALMTDSDIFLLDEATSALDTQEVKLLFKVIRKLKQKGKAIIFISHRMEEIFEIGDMVTVLKDGRTVLSAGTSNINQDILIESMVGRSIHEVFPQKCKEMGEVLLEVRGLSLKGILHNISLTIHRGEVVSIAGLKGHGQGELLECLAGIRRYEEGTVTLNGKPAGFHSPVSAIRSGIILAPENRKTQALFLTHSISRNISISSLFLRQWGGFIKRTEETRFVDKMIEELAVKCREEAEPVDCLSGGNQQKVVLGRVLGVRPGMVLFHEPTRGIDVLTKQEIYKRIRRLAASGVCVLLYSSDLLEAVGLSDTVYTMYEGKITRKLTGEDISELQIMRGAVGV